MVRLEGETAALRGRNISLEMRLLDLLRMTQQQQQRDDHVHEQRQQPPRALRSGAATTNGCYGGSTCTADALRDLRRQLRVVEREAKELREERVTVERRDRQVLCVCVGAVGTPV